jgi:hypothetical protein
MDMAVRFPECAKLFPGMNWTESGFYLQNNVTLVDKLAGERGVFGILVAFQHDPEGKCSHLRVVGSVQRPSDAFGADPGSLTFYHARAEGDTGGLEDSLALSVDLTTVLQGPTG